MSDALLRMTPNVPVEVAYPQGSIVVCRECSKPIYRLQRSIHVGEPAGRTAWKYAPVTVEDLNALIERRDLEPGQRAAIKAMSLEDRITHCQNIPTFKAGDFQDCPACKKQFSTGFIPQGASVEQFGDKGFQIYLHTIPPPGQSRRAS
jgi:hypothetical protein